MLKVDHLDIFYGKTQALWDVSLRVEEKKIVSMVGANEAGKTTLLNAVCGLLRPGSGSMEFMGRRIDGLAPDNIVQMGVSYVPESGKPFVEMTVAENLEMGAYPNPSWKRRKETLERVYGLFPVLRARAKQLARTLSGGERQMLAMGRSLMANPRLCMLDEPSYGLAPLMVKELFKFILMLNQQGISILLVEQNIYHALEIADRAYLLENGRITLEGHRDLFLNNDHVRKAYLGL
ncbi:MAG: branched-chain amino acid ABC transporter ATP-binding protein [Deltaproteobacteria bacterium HGW-Deltaproteobacteria-15]|jgi:branched-chain amino acid transport system ATP-binding protein|nr:MAG: branched-chain amino acid ABC transporter ATP-binding protein [Deltaproteobacteria bacterium HGW-Deltaproteobacteria-15]